MQENERQTGKCIRDVIVLGGMLGAVNWLVSRGDIGWINLNPSPWLLLPILIGGRYGSGPGIISGLLASLGIALYQARNAGGPVPVFAREHSFFFTSLVLGGFLAGELNRFSRGRSQALSDANSSLADQAARLSAELELARETRQDLQRHLALLNAPICALDEDLRKLITDPPAQLMAGLMEMLHKHARISSAGLYQVVGDSLRRTAVLHPTRPLGEVLRLEEVPLAVQALEARSIASVSNPLDTTASQPFLAAIPWNNKDGPGVLLVQDLPLQAYDWPNLAKIQLIVTWAFCLSGYRNDLHRAGELAKPLQLEEFLPLVSQALEAEQIHHLPSVIVRADFKDSDAGKTDREILRALPPTALCTRLPNQPGLVVLLPFNGEAEAQALGQVLAKAGPQTRLSQFLVVGPVKLDDFWAHVTLA